MRAKSNRVREGTGRRFQGRRKGKEKNMCTISFILKMIAFVYVLNIYEYDVSDMYIMDICTLCIFVCTLSVCLSVSLSVCLSVCLSLSLSLSLSQ